MGYGNRYRENSHRQLQYCRIHELSRKTDPNGQARVDLLFSNPLNLESINNLQFNFSTHESIQSLRFALFDDKSNYLAFTLVSNSLGDENFSVDLSKFTESSGLFNKTSVKKIRIGVNSEPNSPADFVFSNLDKIMPSRNSSADGLLNNKDTVFLRSEVTVPVLNSNDALAFYTKNEEIISAFLINQQYGNGRILYLNLPYASQEIALDHIWVLFEGLFELPQNNPVESIEAESFDFYTKNIFINGQVNIQSYSIKPISNYNFSSEIPNYSDVNFSINTSSVEINPSSIGTYSTVFISGPFDMEITDPRQETKHITVDHDCTFLINSPNVIASGTTTFQESYWRDNTRYWGATTTFTGDASFNIRFSDIYLLIFDLKYRNFEYESYYKDISGIYISIQRIEPTVYILIILAVVLLVSAKIKLSHKVG